MFCKCIDCGKIQVPKMIPYVLLLLTFLAFFYRLHYSEVTEIYEPIRADAAQYLKYAANLRFYGVFSQDYPPKNIPPQPDQYRTPGYPIFLSIVMKLGGEKHYYSNIILVQATLGALLVPFTYLIARNLLSIGLSILSSVLVLLSPHLVSLGSYILTETLFSFMLLISVFLYFKAESSGKRFIFAMAGASFGLAYLVTPTVFFIPFILATINCVLYYNNGISSVLKKQAVFVLCFTLFVAGYSGRNFVNVKPENKEGRAWENIVFGTYPSYLHKDLKYKNYPNRDDPRFNEYAKSVKIFLSDFIPKVEEDPVKYIKWFFLGKPMVLWQWNILQGQGDVYIYPVTTSLFTSSFLAKLIHQTMKYLHPIVLVVTLLGGICYLLSLRRKEKLDNMDIFSLSIYGILLYYTALYVVFAALPRHSIPLRPELYLAFSCSLNVLFRQFNLQNNNKSHI